VSPVAGADSDEVKLLHEDRSEDQDDSRVSLASLELSPERNALARIQVHRKFEKERKRERIRVRLEIDDVVPSL